MTGDKSHVGMTQCFLYGEPKELLIHRRLAQTLPRLAVYDHEPCDQCKTYQQQGVILISVRAGSDPQNPYRTGGWVVITDEAFTRAFNQPAPATRAAFIEDEAWDLLALLLELPPEDLAKPITVLDYGGMQVFPAVVEAQVVAEYVPEHPGEGDPYPASLMLTVNKT